MLMANTMECGSQGRLQVSTQGFWGVCGAVRVMERKAKRRFVLRLVVWPSAGNLSTTKIRKTTPPQSQRGDGAPERVAAWLGAIGVAQATFVLA
jgi:hypothetical protein